MTALTLVDTCQGSRGNYLRHIQVGRHFILEMQAAGSSEMFVALYLTGWSHMSRNLNLNINYTVNAQSSSPKTLLRRKYLSHQNIV
jgi:hypothetical protein